MYGGETDGKKHKSRIFICDIFFGNFVRICLSPAPTEYFTPRGCLYGIGCITFCNLHGTGSVLDFICEKKDLVQCSSEIFVDDRLPSYFLVVYTYNKVSFPGKYGFPEKSVLVWILYTDVIYTIICTISGSLPWTARALQVTKVFV